MAKPNGFAGAVALVTGGASGIGRALGHALAERGAHVVLADVDAARAEEAAAEIRDRGRSAESAVLDVTDGAAVERVYRAVAEERGRLDYVFNNAGIGVVGEALEMPLDDWERTIDVNLRGVVYGTLAAYRLMAPRRSGHIVNTASLAGLVPTPSLAAYAATKHAVVGLSTSLRIEAQDHGVRVSVVCPGVIDTPMRRNIKLVGLDRAELDRTIESSPLKLYPADACARDILAGVARNRAVIVVTGAARTLRGMQRLSPGLAEGIIRRIYERQRNARIGGER
jgi:NAD(P)-dependent dehydrogenase (short-subunit alcohol dehydrogenase family)